jgi:hypothetical protein
VKQQHTSTATSILTTKSTYRSLSAQRLSKHTVVTCSFTWPHYAPPCSHCSLTWLPPSVWQFLFLVYFGLVWKVWCCLLSAANRVSHSKISASNPSYSSLTVPWMEVNNKAYDGRLWTTRTWGQHLFYLMYQKHLVKATSDLGYKPMLRRPRLYPLWQPTGFQNVGF